jgi:hypothetical protein
MNAGHFAMSSEMRFAARADLNGAEPVTTVNRPRKDLFASDPLSAAAKWYWRLSEAERAACTLVTVSAWLEPHSGPYKLYSGPDVTWRPKRPSIAPGRE